MYNPFKKSELVPEAFIAYLQRLPEEIKVVWKKDGDLIVGRVEFEDGSFATQGRTSEEFISMVNEGVLIAYDTPQEYFNLLKEVHTFIPPEIELISLRKTKRGKLNLPRDRELAKRVFA